MKLSVSNLAWAQDADFAAGRLLSRLGVTGIEVAPTRIADWEALTPARLADYRKIWAGMGLAISSLQAIFFNRPQLQLLGDTSSFALMAEHMRRIGGIAQALGAGVAVFGAPNNRKRGQLAPAEAETLAAERLSQLGDIAAEHGLTIGLEPVPEVYNADFLTRAADILRMNDLCGHSHVRPHLDTACVGMAGDEIGQAIASAGSALAHYRISAPFMRQRRTMKTRRGHWPELDIPGGLRWRCGNRRGMDLPLWRKRFGMWLGFTNLPEVFTSPTVLHSTQDNKVYCYHRRRTETMCGLPSNDSVSVSVCQTRQFFSSSISI